MKNLKEADLSQFNITDPYYEHSLGRNVIFLSEGCKYIAEEGGAFWLFDIILSYQTDRRVRGEVFQSWVLKRRLDDTWTVTCTDGNETTLVCQQIEYSDFPLSRIQIFLVDQICCLASEY